MIIPAQTLRIIKPIHPFHERTKHNGMTFGLGPAGYDVRIAETIILYPGKSFALASTIERFEMPYDVLARVCDKSTWARRGIAVQNTVLEPGWKGHLTLEITLHKDDYVTIRSGDPIAQILFERLETPTELPYQGKYQDQPPGAQQPIYEV